MKMIILSYLLIGVVVCLFKKIMPFIIAIGFLAAWYMICYSHIKLAGVILFAVMCFVTTLYRIAVDDMESAPKRAKCNNTVKKSENRREAVFYTRWIYYLIPVFWPFLIIKMVLGCKTRPTDMTPYDYEQHLKCNR